MIYFDFHDTSIAWNFVLPSTNLDEFILQDIPDFWTFGDFIIGLTTCSSLCPKGHIPSPAAYTLSWVVGWITFFIIFWVWGHTIAKEFVDAYCLGPKKLWSVIYLWNKVYAYIERTLSLTTVHLPWLLLCQQDQNAYTKSVFLNLFSYISADGNQELQTS